MNGIAQITVAGQKVGLKFGMPAVRRFFEKTMQYELMTDNKYTDLGLAHLVYAGYVNWCIMKDQATELKFEDFYTLIEDADEETRVEVIAAVKAFEESKLIKPLADAADEAQKKKAEISQTSTPLSPSVSENLDIPQETMQG